ncbi:RidA family protein [Chitinophaga flava]|uniref:RidA family protein n=1 Tax=Chitinophaga flava TaxID=2259036 RepID=A0A365XT01_9BACT|nr:RidA family protein [Chitinophaga flava]RBL89479.1 RidA family protein [Chitinophaga flava]
MKPVFFILSLLFSTIAFSQNVQLVNPATLATPKGYSHAAVIDLGHCKMVITSGQVGLDAKGNLAGKDVAAQTTQIFLNLKNILEEAGGSLNDIVKLGYFLTDVKQIQAVRDVRDKFIKTANLPASTLVEVSKLFREDILVEIEATAIISKK